MGSATVGDAGAQATDLDSCVKAKTGAACGEGRICLAGVCELSVCGDGFVAQGEACDDGNEVTGDGCSPSCQARPASCGDAATDGDEECDDGNWYNADGCSDDCTNNECGNGREDGTEECDDGNLVDDDGCSLKCTENRCRNGRLDPGEECDDGNRIHDDGCSNGCLEVMCGNSKVDGEARGGREECDDGNDVNDDACANACTENRCGNARTDPGEACDGDTANLSCSDDCKQTSNNGACKACRESQCSDYMGALDLIAGCVENPNPSFRAQCTAVIDCAKTNGCGYTDAGPTTCFCGTTDLNACQTAGAANGPCQSEWFTAAATESVGELFGRFTDIDSPLPSGMAYYLMECERTLCPEECVP